MAMKKWAVICNTGLGDALLFERLAHALAEEGKSCTVFGRYLDQMKLWYPELDFQTYPQDIDHRFSAFWSSYEGYIFQEYAPGSHVNRLNKWVLGENHKRKGQSWRDHQADFLKEVFHIGYPKLQSSIKAPQGLVHRGFKDRVLIHPTSLKEEKNWPAEKFIALAARLKKRGFDIHFCVTPGERAVWEKHVGQEFSLCVRPLSELAAFLYESAYFIGNDSGVSHLAPALEIPTLKLFDRSSRAYFWSGGWHLTHNITPYPLPTRGLRVQYWKTFLPVARVEKAFMRLLSGFPKANDL
jgi:heptosyltransferase-3